MDWQKPLAPLEHAVCILISSACIAFSPQKFGRKADAIFALILYQGHWDTENHRASYSGVKQEASGPLPTTSSTYRKLPFRVWCIGYSRLSLLLLLFLVQRHISVLAWPPGKSVWLWAKRTFWAPLAVGPQYPWLHLRFWLISFPISKPLIFMGDQDVALCLLLFLSAKKHTKSIKSDSFYWECVCILQDFRRKRNYSISEPLQHLQLVPLPQHLHCQSVLCKSAFFVDRGSPQNWCGGVYSKPKWRTKKKKIQAMDTSKKIACVSGRTAAPRVSLPPRLSCAKLCLLS